MKGLKNPCSPHLRPENAAPHHSFSAIILTLHSCNGLPQLNKAQYCRIHVTAATSLSPSLSHEDMAFFVFCEQLSWNSGELPRHLIR